MSAKQAQHQNGGWNSTFQLEGKLGLLCAFLLHKNKKGLNQGAQCLFEGQQRLATERKKDPTFTTTSYHTHKMTLQYILFNEKPSHGEQPYTQVPCPLASVHNHSKQSLFHAFSIVCTSKKQQAPLQYVHNHSKQSNLTHLLWWKTQQYMAQKILTK